MRRLNPSPSNLQISFDNSFIDEFNKLGFAETDEVDQGAPDTSYFNGTTSPSDSMEAVNPPDACPLPIEDPIVTYDSVVTQMITNGVEWIPPNQIGKSLSDVRLAAPDQAQLRNCRVTAPTEAPPEVTLANAHVKASDFINNRTSLQHSNCGASESSVSANVSQLRELQVQLNQEKATRKQQEDYIQQLQRYYDNLLAKHAAAEITIDHLRFQTRIGCDESTPAASVAPPTSLNNSSSFATLRGRKLISASLDTCAPTALARRLYQPNVSGSLMTFHEKPTPTQLHGSPNAIQKPFIQPQVHLMSLNSSANHLERERLNEATVFANSKSGCNHNKATDEDDTVSCSDNNDDFNEDYQSNESTQPITSDAAKSLEEQLKTSLIAIHNRLNAVEANILSDYRNEELIAIRCILEDIQRRYQAGYYLWPDGGQFDSQAVIGAQLESLAQRLRRASACPRDGSGANVTPSRPSSLDLIDPHRSVSENSNLTSAHAIATGTVLSDPVDVLRGSSSSSPSSVSAHLNSAHVAATLNSPSSSDTVEAHFVHLLARYNKLKATHGHEKEVESLIQRMLQLADRYSAQSSVISRPRSLRRMFESDYGVINSVKAGLIAGTPTGNRSQELVSKVKTMKDACTAPLSGQMISPDSGVPQTPIGSSGSSGASCNYGAYRRGNFVRQLPVPATTVSDKQKDSQRKQSDSGFSATNSCSAFIPTPPSFKGRHVPSFSSSSTATNADEDCVDVNLSLPSKMLPNEVMSLEADIQRLRQSIARLTSTASVSPATRHLENGAGLSSSSSTYGENLHRRIPRRSMNGNMKSGAFDLSSRRSGHSSSGIQHPRLPTSSSSSGEDTAYSTYNRPRPLSKGHRQVLVVNKGDNTFPPMEVIGSALNPQRRTPISGSARTYHRTSSKKRVRSRHIEDIGDTTTSSHRRSRSSTDHRTYYHPCGTCGGSGYNLDAIGRVEREEIRDPPVHSRTVSDSYTMPARVIYEYGQSPWVRLPVQQDFNSWTERVYGMQELYGSAVSPQVGRAYNTIGHQPSPNLRGYSNQSQWTPRQPIVVPATIPSLVPQRTSRRTRQYLASTSHGLHPREAESSSSADETHDVAMLPTSRSFCAHPRRLSSGRQTTELESLSSASSSNAFAAARCVTQMAHQLNSKLTQHRDRHRTSVR